MALFKTSNPALTKDTFTNIAIDDNAGEIMTVQGTVNKTALLLLILMVPALYTWNLFTSTEDPGSIMPYFWTGLIGGVILSFVIVFKKEWSPSLAPIYAILEGLFLGGLSAMMNYRFPGIVLQALVLTFGICGVLLLVYKLRIIRATENFKLMVVAGTGGIAIYYMLSMLLSFFGIQLPLIHESSTAGIIFSLFVVVIASLNLVLDFDFIEQGAEQKAPKYMEWYGAFGLMVTLIWLYIEILRLLSKLNKK